MKHVKEQITWMTMNPMVGDMEHKEYLDPAIEAFFDVAQVVAGLTLDEREAMEIAAHVMPAACFKMLKATAP